MNDAAQISNVARSEEYSYENLDWSAQFFSTFFRNLFAVRRVLPDVCVLRMIVATVVCNAAEGVPAHKRRLLRNETETYKRRQYEKDILAFSLGVGRLR